MIKLNTRNVDEKPDLMERIINLSYRYVPDAMVFALALTVLVYIITLLATDSGPLKIMDYWFDGFWSLLTFTIQVSLLLLTGFMVADSKPIKNILTRICLIPKTPRQAVAFYIAVTTVLMYIHFALGMAAAIMLGRGIIVAQKMKNQKLPYAAFVASGYIGFMTISSPTAASPILVATPGHFLQDLIGIVPITKTVLDPYMLGMNLFLFLSCVFLFPLILPKKKVVEVDDETLRFFSSQEEGKEVCLELTPAQRLDKSPVLMYIVGLAGLFIIVRLIFTKGLAALDLNNINFTFMILAVLLHKTPEAFINSAKKASETIFGVLIQYPFYAGMFGMIKFSGLGSVIASWFVSISTAHTFPFIVFLYSGIFNTIVPSGGSKFLIEAPYIFPAAKDLGANIAYTINAYTTGDLIADMIQPFWALPLLSAFRLPFRAILPYTLAACIFGTVVMSIMFLVFMN